MTMSTMDGGGPAERLRRVAVRAGAVRAATRGAAGATGGQGRDDTGLVWVTTGAGGRVTAVHVDDRWFEGRGATALGPALLQAYRAGSAAVMTAAAAADDGPALFTGPEPDREPARSRPAGPPVPVTFDEVRAALRERDRRRAESRTGTAPPAAELRGPHGFVTVTVHGHDVAAVEVDPRAPRSRGDQIARDALAAFRQLGGGHAGEF